MKAISEIFTGPSIDTLRAKIDRFQAKRAEIEPKIAALEDTKRDNLAASAEGDANARAAFDHADAEIVRLQRDVAILRDVISGLNRELSSAEAQARAEARKREVEAHRNLFALRRDTAARLETALTAAVPNIKELLHLTQCIKENFVRLGGPNSLKGKDTQADHFEVVAWVHDFLYAQGLRDGVLGATPRQNFSSTAAGLSFAELDATRLRTFEINQ
jgi:hypothetical protein